MKEETAERVTAAAELRAKGRPRQPPTPHHVITSCPPSCLSHTSSHTVTCLFAETSFVFIVRLLVHSHRPPTMRSIAARLRPNT